jgi:hypothetical protein
MNAPVPVYLLYFLPIGSRSIEQPATAFILSNFTIFNCLPCMPMFLNICNFHCVQILDQAKKILLCCATPESIVRLRSSPLAASYEEFSRAYFDGQQTSQQPIHTGFCLSLHALNHCL